jgi:glycosyltransferase involved in cell wall biosynthesis
MGKCKKHMKVLFLTPYILGDSRTLGSSTDVRVYPLAKELEKRGASCKFLNSPQSYILNPLNRLFFPLSLENFLSFWVSNKVAFDVLFISRVSSIFVRLIQKKTNSKVIFDLDDPLFLPSRKIGRFKVRSPSFDFVERVMKNSEAITASSHYILAYAKNFNHNSFLIHTPIDTDEFNPLIRKRSEKFTIGWVGNASGSLVNLKMLRRPLMKLGKRYDIRFKMVSYLGDEKVKNAFRKVEGCVEVDYGMEQWVPLNELPRYICGFDVFASPFTKTSWFEGKSIVKAAIGMAIGIPVVASPVGEQKYVLKHGINGFLAKNEEEWYKYLKMLIEDEKLRGSMGNSGRETAEKKLSSRVCGKKLFDTINRLMQ